MFSESSFKSGIPKADYDFENPDNPFNWNIPDYMNVPIHNIKPDQIPDQPKPEINQRPYATLDIPGEMTPNPEQPDKLDNDL